MIDVNVESKDEEKIEEEECQCNEESEETEETCDCNEETCDSETEDEKADYKVYGKETAEEAKNVAEKMLNEVYSTFKAKQKDWNKTLEEYKANKPAADLLEYEDSLIIKMDLPRVSKEDISITMCPESIEITVEFPDELEDDEEVKVLRKERCVGVTKNIIPIPVEIKVEEVGATFENNELTLTLPKVQPKKVEVEIV